MIAISAQVPDGNLSKEWRIILNAVVVVTYFLGTPQGTAHEVLTGGQLDMLSQAANMILLGNPVQAKYKRCQW